MTLEQPPPADWDPRSDHVQRDQLAAYDRMRDHCPVAYSEFLHWSLLRHEDVTRALGDHHTFSNAASRHPSVPHGLDPPEHTEFRKIIEPYFSAQRMEAFEPVCRAIANDLAQELPAGQPVDLMDRWARPLAALAQCAFLGWPRDLHATLIRWTDRNHDATLAQDQAALAEIAADFEQLIEHLLQTRRDAGARPEDDITASLMHDRVWDRPLTGEEIASILRNWTVGEIGTISASLGICVHYLATHPDLQDQLRFCPSLVPQAIDEMLRIHGPLVTNRRITRCPVDIGGRRIPAGERISLVWVAANRDPAVFAAPDEFRWDRDSRQNLLYGAGIHVCPGAPLARLELRIALESLLERSAQIELATGHPPVLATYPASGFASLPSVIRLDG